MDTPDFGEVTEGVLAGRKHVVVRAIADTEVSSPIPFYVYGEIESYGCPRPKSALTRRSALSGNSMKQWRI